ncbi:hypothetical protein C0995_008319 [Termitomyces sp. Mi166|nr:hypothetical protein C0995_008319 [Termitomyces sp. Mi166\
MSTASYKLKNGSIDVLSSIRSAILDFQPFSAFFNSSDLSRSRQILSVKPPQISTRQFNIMEIMIEKTDVPQVEFAWVGRQLWNYIAANITSHAQNVATDQDNGTSLAFDRLVLLKPLSRGFVFALAKAVQYTRTLVDTEPLKGLVEGPLIPDQTVQTEEDFVNFINKQSGSE